MGDNDNNNNNNKTRSSKKFDGVDLDAFLTGVESKMRGPFSSLELPKAIATAATRDGVSPERYLRQIRQVISKADKTVQLKILIGLLGIDPNGNASNSSSRSRSHQDDGDGAGGATGSSSTDREIDNILTQTQEAPLHEEWVRIVSSLVQGIMFQEEVEEEGGGEDGTTTTVVRPCRGPEANELLEKTCADILKQVQKIEKETDYESDEEHDVPSRLEKADADPTLAPFRYALLNAPLLKNCIPETHNHAHFQVDERADILKIDSSIEQAKALEEKEHASSIGVLPSSTTTAATTVPTNNNAESAADKSRNTPNFPGFRTAPKPAAGMAGKAAAAASKRQPPPKSSMFMPTRKPGQLPAGAGGRAAGMLRPGTTKPGAAAKKVGLHTRKAGAAQALLAKGRRKLQSSSAAGGGGGTGGAAPGKTSLLSTRMKAGVGGMSAARAAAGGVRGRAAAKLGSSGKSKTMMIDVSEVKDLTKEQQEREMAAAPGKGGKLAGRKRKASAAAASSADASAADIDTDGPRKVAKLKREEPEDDGDGDNRNDSVKLDDQPISNETEEKPAAAGTSALASAALSAYQAQLSSQQQKERAAGPAPAPAPTPSPKKKQQDWKEMLESKSNRLSAEDRFRVQQFFVDHYNPTPDQPTYKMKLHEERSTDPKTGVPVKETYYLELDYNTFTSKQSKKTKRYT